MDDDHLVFAATRPTPESEVVSRRMRANRGRDTRPEVAVRSQLHRLGLRFRKNVPVLTARRRVNVDIVFPRARLAIFVDGCFWHACPDHGTQPRRNADYWASRLERNVQRDLETTELLEAQGWTVVRVWEHEPADDVAARIGALMCSE